MKNLIPSGGDSSKHWEPGWLSVIRSSTKLILPVISKMVPCFLGAVSAVYERGEERTMDHLQEQTFLESVILTIGINNKTKLVQ